MIFKTVDTKDKFVAAVDAEVQEIRADKQREARFMKDLDFEDLTFRYQHDNRYLRVSVNGDDTQGLLLYWQMNTNYDYYGAKYFEFAL